MLSKRNVLISCAVLFLLLLWFLWNNALVLDDFHPSGEEIYKSYMESIQDVEGGQENNRPILDSKEQSDVAVKKGFYIHVNLDQLNMYVYKNGELIKTYPCSGGKASTPSPIGTWKIISKDTWGEGFGGAWLGFNVPWGMYGIHGTIEPWSIGRSNASKGCIRMKNKDVRELYKIVPHGTIVTIVHDSKPFHQMKSGDVGSDVLLVQKALKKLGYYSAGANGRFGTALKASVQKFQKQNKLYSSGKVNKQTYDLIMQKYKEIRDSEEQQKQEQLRQEQLKQEQPKPELQKSSSIKRQ